MRDTSPRQRFPSGVTVTHGYDGLGQRIRHQEDSAPPAFYLRSSALGGAVLAEVKSDGARLRAYVHAAGEVVAKYEDNRVEYQHRNPVTGSQRWTKADGTQASFHSSTELDPMGTDAGVVNWAALSELRRTGGELVAPRYGDSLDQIIGCTGSGAPAACGGYLRDIVTGGGASVFRNIGRTGFGEGPSIQRVIAYGRDGRVLGSSSTILLPGQSGWDGSLDGTYRRTAEIPRDGLIAVVGGAIFQRLPGGGFSFAPQKSEVHIIPLPDLRSGLEGLLKKGNCGKYVQALLNKAAELFPRNPLHGKTIVEIYEKITRQGGYHNDARFFNTVSGDLFVNKGGEPATVHLFPERSYGPPNAWSVNYARRNYIYGALHETFHLAGKGGYNDQQMVEAAYALAGKQLPNRSPDAVFDWSTNFDDELLKYCPK